jgi:hypothetical protein
MVEAEYNLASERDDLIQNQEAFQVKFTDLYLLCTDKVSPISNCQALGTKRFIGEKCSLVDTIHRREVLPLFTE